VLQCVALCCSVLQCAGMRIRKKVSGACLLYIFRGKYIYMYIDVYIYTYIYVLYIYSRIHVHMCNSLLHTTYLAKRKCAYLLECVPTF